MADSPAASSAARARRTTDLIGNLIRDAAARAALSPEARLAEDLGLDSLDVLELAVHVEESLGVRLADEDLKGVTTVADLLAAVERRAVED
jgi:acyl carrier protein